MFYSYDLSNFGLALRNIRKKCGLSQLKTSSRTGINEDTLRKLENGHAIPKYETLEILSAVYKYDLLKELEHYRIDEHFYKYYRKMDKIITTGEFSLISELTSEFKEKIKEKGISPLLINNSELMQFELYLNAISEYSTDSICNFHNSERMLTEALQLTISDFEISRFSEINYNIFEIRILLLLGLTKEKTGDLSLSTKILLFIQKYLLNGADTDSEVQLLILKIYSNLSYNYHNEDDYISALKYADEGIAYAVNHCSMGFLHLLYGRKGIAEFLLGYSFYIDALQKSIQLLEINNQYNLVTIYKNIYYEKYKISI